MEILERLQVRAGWWDKRLMKGKMSSAATRIISLFENKLKYLENY